MKYRVMRYDQDCYAIQRQRWLLWHTLDYWTFEAGWIPYVFDTPEAALDWLQQTITSEPTLEFSPLSDCLG